MRKIIALAAPLVLITIPTPIAAQTEPADDSPASARVAIDPVNLAIAREILAIGFPEERRLEIFSATNRSMLEQIKTSMVDLPDDAGIRRIFDEEVARLLDLSEPVLAAHIPSLADAWAKSYASMFSRAELEEILAFVRTPAGRKFFEQSSFIVAEPNFVAANQAYMADVKPVIAEWQAAVIERVITYLQSQEEQSTTES